MESSTKLIKKSLGIIKLLYTPLSISYILYFAYINKHLLAKIFSHANIYFIVTASLVWCLLHILSPVSSKIIFTGLGYSINLKTLIAIHISRLPARYLPGGIWHTVGRYSDYLSFGTSKKHLTLLAILETFFPCIITLLIGGSFIWASKGKGLTSYVAGGMALISFCLLLMIPIWVKFKYPDLSARNLFLQYIKLTLTSIVFWIIASISFLFYYSSMVTEINGMSLLHVAATYIFSWGIGYIAIFAPQGIGIFEVVASKLMEIPLSMGGAVSFIAGFRLVVLIADVTSWITFRLYLGCLHTTGRCSVRTKVNYKF